MPIGRTIYAKSVFFDTGAFVALYNSDDHCHVAAKNCIDRIKAAKLPAYVSNVTIIETYKRLLFDKSYSDAVEFLKDIYDGHKFNIIRLNQDDEFEAKKIIERYSDQMFSFADAINFAMMKRYGLLKAFCFDRHYSVFGFVTIPPFV